MSNGIIVHSIGMSLVEVSFEQKTKALNVFGFPSVVKGPKYKYQTEDFRVSVVTNKKLRY